MIKTKSDNKIKKTGRSKNAGSALLVAIIASIVVIAFSLSLLIAAYSLFQSSVQKRDQVQLKEYTKTLALEIESEITDPNFASCAEQNEALQNGEDNLWFYLRYNVEQNNWPFYEQDEGIGHTKENAYRYFDINVSGGEERLYATMPNSVSVCMYWTKEVIEDEGDEEIYLTVVVTCERDKQACTMSSYYTLSKTLYSDAEAPEGSFLSVNPQNNNIALNECWKWSKLDQN